MPIEKTSQYPALQWSTIFINTSRQESLGKHKFRISASELQLPSQGKACVACLRCPDIGTAKGSSFVA